MIDLMRGKGNVMDEGEQEEKRQTNGTNQTNRPNPSQPIPKRGLVLYATNAAGLTHIRQSQFPIGKGPVLQTFQVYWAVFNVPQVVVHRN